MTPHKKIIAIQKTVSEIFTFLDFETTGLSPTKNKIIEIGALKVYPSGRQEKFQTLINPNQPLPEIITKITHITDDMLATAPTLDTQLPKLLTFINTSTIVAHNAIFDISFLENACTQLGLPIPKNPVFCTLKWARQLTEPHCSLTDLGEKYNITNENAHRALDDAIATKDLFYIFKDKTTSDTTNTSEPPKKKQKSKL